MYVRVKRQKTTVFLQVNPTDTVATLKSAIGDLIQQVGDLHTRGWKRTHILDLFPLCTMRRNPLPSSCTEGARP